MQRRLSASERDAVREQYADHPVMRMLSVPCLRMETRLEHLRPKREEVFWDVFCILDDFSGDISADGIECDALWFQLMNENREAFCASPEDELETLTAHTLAAVVACLTTCGNYPWNNYHTAVYRILQGHRMDSTALVSAFVGQAERIPEFSQCMKGYMDGETSLADEVEELFDSLKEDGDDNVLNTTSQQKPQMRITEGKLTSIVVTLDAMYNAGWFEAPDGEKMPNRNTAIAQILQLAFGQKQANVQQLLSTPKSRGFQGEDWRKKYLDELKEAFENYDELRAKRKSSRKRKA